jgi:hypothetical protein
MKALVAAFALALLLSAPGSVALAGGGEDQDVSTDQPDGGNNNDQGITALHDAIKDKQSVDAALRAECADRADTKCKAAYRAAREAFKAARERAIEEHRVAFEAKKAAAQKARDDAKQTAKDALKDKVTKIKETARNKANGDKNAGHKNDKDVANKDDTAAKDGANGNGANANNGGEKPKTAITPLRPSESPKPASSPKPTGSPKP